MSSRARRIAIAGRGALAALACAAALAPGAAAAPGDVTTFAGNGADQASGDGTQATAAGIGKPEGLAVTTAGVFITHNTGYLVRRVDAMGVISTFAGGGTERPGDGGPATDADLEDSVEGVVRDRYGSVYFSERHRVRGVFFGFIDTVVGTGQPGYSGDGREADRARIDRPHGLAFDLEGGGYLADCNRHVVRRVDAFGIIDTVAGTGDPGYSGDNGPATQAKLDCPTDVAIDSLGNLYISDAKRHVVRKVTPGGTITTVAGTGTAGYSGDGSLATTAQLRAPHGIAFDGADRLFIADAGNHVIRRVDTSGRITTVAGTPGTAGFQGDGGPATAARFDTPHYLDFEPESGDLYVSDSMNHRVRRVEAIGIPNVPPTPSIDSGPPSPGSDSTPTWSFSVSPPQDVVYECRLSRDATVVDDWGNCSSPQTYDLSAEPAGSYTFEVRATTLAGTGAPSSSVYDYLGASALDHFEIDPIGEQTAGRPFTLTVRAKAADGTIDTSFNGTVDLSSSAGAIEPLTSDPFVSGVLTQTVTLDGSYDPGATITATAAGPTGTSAPFVLHDRVYHFKQTTAHTGTLCASADAARDMEEGYAGQDPEETFTPEPTDAETISFCSPAFTAAEPLAAGTSTVYAYVRNDGLLGCDVSARLLVNGTTSLGTATRTAPGFSPVTLYAWTINRSATTLAAGDRLNVRMRLTAGPSCTQAYIHYGGTANRSRLELFGGSVAPTITGGPGALNSDETPSWSFTGEPGATFECRLTEGGGAAVPGYDWSPCTSPREYDMTTLPDGPYAFAVRQTVDAVTSPPAISDYELDTTAPSAPTIDASPPSPGNATTVSWDFSGQASVGFECRLLKGATVISDFAGCSGSQQYTLVDGDGVYTFEVRQTDAAGNESPVAGGSYELDTSVPAAPSIDAPPASPGSDETPEWGFSGESGAAFECRLERGATVVFDWATCSSAHSYDLSAEPDGTYAFLVRQADGSGNTSGPSSDDYELDTQAPAAPTIDSAPSSPAGDPTPTWTFSGEPGAGASCRLTRGATVVSDWSSCSSPRTFDLSAEQDGVYTFEVLLTDAAGNMSAAASDEYELDRGAPGAPSIDAEPVSPGNDPMPSWDFSGDGGATFECRLERMDGTAVSDWAACASSRTYDLSAQADGAYGFSVRQTEAAGNTSPAAESWYVLDTTPGLAPTLSGPPSPGNDPSPGFDFSGDAGATFECRLDRGAVPVVGWEACSSPKSYTLATDGDYTVSVRQLDGAGNPSPEATADYRLDTQGPGAPSIDSAPSSPGNDTTPEWTFSGEAGAALECRLLKGGTEVEPFAPCSGSRTYPLSDGDGDYAFEVRQTDAAGNAGPAAGSDYVLDATPPPAPTFTSEPPMAGSATNPSWSFTGEADATFQCRLERGSTLVSDWQSCSDPHTLDLSGEPDGLYALSVRAVDAVGNAGEPVTDLYGLDRVAPGAPAITDSPGAVGNDPAPKWAFDVDGDALPECRLERRGAPVFDWQACSSPVTYDLAAAEDGEYRFLVRAHDAAGNVGPESDSDYVLDRVAPAAPSIDSGPGSAGSSRTPAWSFSGEAGATHECRLTGEAGVVFDWSFCEGSASYDLAGAPDGAYEFAVRGRDEAGNTGSASTSTYRLDTTGATVAIESGPGPVGNDARGSWTFAGEPGAELECSLQREGSLVSGWAACTSPHGYDLAGEPDGAYTFQVRARDGLDNTGEPASYVHTLDRAAPAPPTFTRGPGALGRDLTPTWALAAEDGALVECRLLRDGAPVEELAPCAGELSRDLTAPGDGAYAMSARATDAAGNVSAESQSGYRLDATAPGPPEITDGPGASGRSRRVSWAFTGEPSAVFECRLGRERAVLDAWNSCSAPARYSLEGSDPGEHTFRVRARDEAGNLGPSTSSDYELLAPRHEQEPPADPQPPRDEDPPPPPADDIEDPPSARAEGSPSAPAPVAGEATVAPARDAAAEREPERKRRDERRRRDDGGDAGTGIPLDERDGGGGGTPGTADGERPENGESAGEQVLDALGDTAAWAGRNLDKTGFPLLLLMAMVGYVAVQNRLDRRDPKLALAPIHADRELEFLPPPMNP